MANRQNSPERPARKGIPIITSLALAAVILVAGVLILPSYLAARSGAQPGGSSQPAQSQPGQTGDPQQTTPDPGTAGPIIAGVSINGVDVSGMTKAEALTATAKLQQDLLSGTAISITADDVSKRFTAADFSATTDLEAVVDQALAFGKTGSAAERRQVAEQAKTAGKPFSVRIVARREPVLAALAALKQEVDRAPVDASYEFMPHGFTEDGKAYTPDLRKLADAHSNNKHLDRPALVLVDPADAPLALRYQYWNVNKYIPGYIPADAPIARFRYTPEVPGRDLDVAALADQVVTRLNGGDLADLAVKSRPIEPKVKVSDLKQETILITSWTSSYRTHAGRARNWNVSRMSSFVNGIVIEPGQTWSMNKTAGPRNSQTAKTIGWKAAAGIVNGGYVDEEGGGVCQISSSTYNAALRGGLTIAALKHHSIPSDYVPLGLDATISTPSPDLALKNDGTKPIYFVSYVNPLDKNVTVEVYGQQPVDPTHGPVIYDFTSNNKGTRFGKATMRMVYNTSVTPDGVKLSPSKPTHVYAKARSGIQIQTYKHLYSLDGKELTEKTPYDTHKYPVINGTTYVYGPDPSKVTPTPSPTTAATTAAKPAATTAAKPATTTKPS